MDYPTHDQVLLGWAERADIEALDITPAPAATREPRHLDIALAALFGLAIGILACAGLVLTHSAPGLRCATFSPIVER